jgi:ABC-type dipeptide/oligopeptide/nickel transport system permease component
MTSPIFILASKKKFFLRKLTTIILVLLITSPVFGFGKHTPDRILIKYLKSLYSNNLKETYSYISKADKNTISKNEFIKQNSLDDPFTQEIAKTVSSLRKYKVNETIINEDSATVNITVTSPDMSKVMGEIFGPFHGPKSMKNPQEATRYMLKQYLKKGNVPMVKERGTFTLVNEEGRWKVLLNLESKL